MCYHKGLVSIKKKQPTADMIPVFVKFVNNLAHDACSEQNLYCQQILMEKGHRNSTGKPMTIVITTSYMQQNTRVLSMSKHSPFAKGSLPVHKSPPLVSYLNHTDPTDTIPFCFLRSLFNIISHSHTGLQNKLYAWVFQPNTCMHSSSFPVMQYAPPISFSLISAL